MDADADPLLTEMAHVLFLDMEGYSRLPLERQASAVRELRLLVRAAPEFSRCEKRGELLRIDTGDGVALIFFEDFQAPIRCACEIAAFLGRPPCLPIRMGLHTGPVIRTRDINGLENVSGSGINLAQRVMDCGDAGHILLSRSYADLLRQMDFWLDGLHDLGEVQVKHSLQLFLVSFYQETCGNPLLPRCLSVPAAPLPPTSLPFWQPGRFVGRASTLASVHDLLQAATPVALVGISGLGKTLLALHYAHLRLADYPGGVFWINAADNAHLREDYVTLGRSFFSLSQELSAETCIARLRDCLARLKEPALLIFDNVTAETDLSFLPSSPQCRLLLTTQTKHLLPPSFEAVELPRLEADAALALLLGTLEAGEEERDAARRIAAAVGHLPLALALVAHHRQRLQSSFAEYLPRFLSAPDHPAEYQVRHALERAAEKFTAATGHKGRIYETIERSYQSLNPPAQTALAAAGVCAAAGIPRGLLREVLSLGAGENADTDWDEALADLTDASLLSEEEPANFPTAGGSGGVMLHLHELVRVFARMQLTDEAFSHSLTNLSLILTARLQAANDRLDWREVPQDMAHVLAAVAECRKHALPEDLCRLLIALGRHLTLNRDSHAAAPPLREALALAERLHGPVHLDCAQLLRLLSEAQHLEDSEDRPNRALRDARAALRIARKVYSADAVELSEYYGFVGYLLKDRRRFRRARPYYEKMRHLQMEVHGGRHPKVAVCLNDLGMFYFEQADFVEAERHLRQALALEDGFAPHDHTAARFTPYLRHNLGRILTARKQLPEALELHQSALDLDRTIHGDSHPRIASGLYYMACVFDALSRRDEARTYYAQALILYTKLFGDDNYRCATVREKLAALDAEH